MKRVLAWAGALLLGIAFGLLSGWGALAFGRASFMDQVEGWRYSRAAGAVSADAYTRAIIAREGLLALSAKEALYFTLDQDEHGAPLSESCVYELAGGDIAARWWSVTIYAPDNYLPRNNDHAFSIDASRVETTRSGQWVARISPVRGDAANWISSREARRGFSLTLRAYNPQRDFENGRGQMPRLTTLSCPKVRA